MKTNASCRGQRGVALMIVLAILVVVSLGILAMSNGAVNMRRSSIMFGRANEAYNAASAGLSAARGYLKGLSYENTAITSLAGTLGAAGYDVSIALTGQTPAGTPITQKIFDNSGNEIPDKYIKKWVKTYTIASTGASNPAKRVLRYKVSVTKTQLISSMLQIDTTYDIVSGGNLDLSGLANFGKVHTNQDLKGSGNAHVNTGTCSGA